MLYAVINNNNLLLHKYWNRASLRAGLQKQLDMKLARVVHFADDTTESKRFENEAMEYKKKLEEENKMKRLKSISCSNDNKMVTIISRMSLIMVHVSCIKQLIQLRAEQRQAEVQAAKMAEKELQKLNPINWSKTLW